MMEGASSNSSTSGWAKVKVGGLWSGTIEVDLDNWTVSMLRAELGKRSNFNPDTLNVICAGRILKQEFADRSLTDVGLKCNSKILMSKVALDQAKAINDELQTHNRLARIKCKFRRKRFTLRWSTSRLSLSIGGMLRVLSIECFPLLLAAAALCRAVARVLGLRHAVALVANGACLHIAPFPLVLGAPLRIMSSAGLAMLVVAVVGEHHPKVVGGELLLKAKFPRLALAISPRRLQEEEDKDKDAGNDGWEPVPDTADPPGGSGWGDKPDSPPPPPPPAMFI